MAFNYAINDVPDCDQRWDALPRNGSMYCVPTSAINWMYYYGRTGRQTLSFQPPFPSHIPLNIASMGGYMDTDPQDGTSSSDAFDGLLDWLDDHNIPAFVTARRARENDDITYVSIRNQLQAGANLIVSRGRYRKEDGVFERIGGHAMSLIGLRRTDAGVITMRVRDPADDRNLDSQSASAVTEVELTEKRRNIEGDHVTVLRWGAGSVNPPYLCIDGWLSIRPMFAVTNVSAAALDMYTADPAGGSTTTRSFPLPFEDALADLALHPSAPVAAVVAARSNETWTIDLLDGTWRRIDGATGARRITYGGRRTRLFVAGTRDVTSYDDAGRMVSRRDVDADIEAVSFDHRMDRLLLATRAERLLGFTSALDPAFGIAAPTLAGGGRLGLSVNPRNGEVLLTREGSGDVAALRWSTQGAARDTRFRLLSRGPTSAVHASRRDRLHAVDDGRIATFNTLGERLADKHFDGLAAGPLLKFARSTCALDEARSRRPEWRN